MYSEIFSKITTPELNQYVVERQRARCGLSNIPKIMEILELNSNPVILDVGAGSGQYSYAFSEYLQGNGNIYAVEVLSDRYEYIKEQVIAKGYKNIFPVLLSKDNMDDFYRQHNYDLVFFGNSFEYINNKLNFLSKLRERLKEDGKLAIIVHRDVTPFSGEDITDNNGLLNAILNEPQGSVFFLSEKKEPLASLNYFFNNLEWTAKYLRYCWRLNWLPVNQLDELEQRTFMGIISFLKREESIFDNNFEIKNNELFTSKIILMFKIINKLIISDYYKKYLRENIFKEFFLPNFNRMQDSIFLQEVKEVMSSASYSFVGAYDFIPWYYLVIFNK